MENKKWKAESVLSNLIDTFLSYLEELSDPNEIYENADFVLGEMTAYVECLEWIQMWEGADRCGLGFEIEKRFPV